MKKLTGILLATALTTGCAIDPYTGEEKVSNTAWGTGIGAGAGAATGAAIGAIAGGGKGAALGAAIGAGVGAAGGAGVGYYMDTQEKKLRLRLESTGVRVQRTGDNLQLIMPGNITFATDSDRLNRHFIPVLDSVAVILKEFKDTNIDVAGFTDSTGSAQYNQELSERRAASVANYLISAGVGHSRIQSRGFGERYPVASNNSAAGREQNRRVEINIRPK
ncbi:OmpA family protein [methanotrophic endosymbiont of Bathymodiolus puteoserpentis (Logatchev)]|jgi:outer membrane protein OmpA-like peptidoglycan-associated protein|uniref:OmpA family protein n=1 Tax=methanotrophic endosymbiont of Bathymodiolus puteoserpentis (Logatchev) TaxID=343235 RepID=UPI0013C9FF74|nr:OmpA family protein [methanotrophic endosymbiont of Bathymodiolus puteoserpentis (Logatchev)]SHE22655.1 Outer membrane protein [methanotrophic endosymbiont of Bathymodiolus puteoserpentis (Logatchev)]